jgi:hypothetical protein
MAFVLRLLVTPAAAIALIAGIVTPRLSPATLVAADSFLTGSSRPLGQYPTGNITLPNSTANLGWTGQYTGTTSGFTVQNSAAQNAIPVTYDTDVTLGGTQGGLSWAGAGDATTRSIVRSLTTVATSSTEWWMSIMVSRPAGASWGVSGTLSSPATVVGGFYTNASSFNGLSFGLSLSDGGAAPDLVLRSGPTSTLTTLKSDVPSEELQYIIAKLSVNSPGNDEISVWVNPSDVSSEAALGTAISITGQDIANSLTPFLGSRFVTIGAGTARSGATIFDELRLATNLGSLVAIPEPSAFLAFGLIGSAVAATRSARRR